MNFRNSFFYSFIVYLRDVADDERVAPTPASECLTIFFDGAKSARTEPIISGLIADADDVIDEFWEDNH